MSGDKAALPKLNDPNAGRKRHFGEAPQRKLFDHFRLTMDKETAKYMPYSSVAFPKLSGADPVVQQSNELDNLWLVGFLDHERETEKKTKLKELAHFVGLPGGALMPGAATELRRLYNKERQRVSTAEKREKELTPGQARRVLGQSATAPRLSDTLMLRLRELAATNGSGFGAAEDSAMAGPNTSDTSRNKAKGRKKGVGATKKKVRHSKKSPFAVYERENAKLRRTIRERRPMRHQAMVKSLAMDDLYELEREQTAAAIVIQGCYRRYVNLCMWQTYLHKARAATKIQRYARGMIVRAMVLRWHMRRSWLVIVAQSIVRGVLARKCWAVQCEFERRAAIKCQTLVRSHLSRVLLKFLRRMRAANRIQAMWRGSCGRAKADRLWLDSELTKIQALARGYLGRKVFHALSQEMMAASVNVQRYTRGMRMRQRRSAMLWERENERRRVFLRVLRSEDEYLCEELTRAKKRLARRQLDEKIKEATKRLREMREEVRRVEWDFICLRNERAQVSPRAVAQGWTDQLDQNRKEHRKWVTNAKLETIFTAAVYLRQREADRARAHKEIAEFEWEIAAIKERRNDELEALWARESERKWRTEHRRQVTRVADQKRKWRLKWYTKSGKPDKRRRPGHPWKPEVFAGQERDTFFMGGVDLMASGQEPPPRMGTEGGLKLIEDQVALQNARNQMQQYSSLLRPVFENIADSMLDIQIRGYPPKKPIPVEQPPLPPQALGFDATGAADDAVLEMRPVSPADGGRGDAKGGRRPFVSQIPWNLLDDLEAEKTRVGETGVTSRPQYSTTHHQSGASRYSTERPVSRPGSRRERQREEISMGEAAKSAKSERLKRGYLTPRTPRTPR